MSLFSVYLALALLIAWICATLANNKGYSPLIFGIPGFFFFLITLIVVPLLPKRTA